MSLSMSRSVQWSRAASDPHSASQRAQHGGRSFEAGPQKAKVICCCRRQCVGVRAGVKGRGKRGEGGSGGDDSGNLLHLNGGPRGRERG